MSKEKRKALGRGLGALLPTTPPTGEAGAAKSREREAGSNRTGYLVAGIEEIHPSPEQPRRRFDDTLLSELAQSIGEHGIIQPLIVRRRDESDGYWLIAGERRWRAAQRAGLSEVPIVVHNVSSQESFERAIVENVQRADLNPIEEALAFERLADEFSLSQEEIAQKVGKDRSTVANSLRLLRLPLGVRGMVEEGKLSMGHARALLGLEHGDAIESGARKVVSEGLSVRATESWIRNKDAPSATKPKLVAPKNASVRDVENRLTKSLGAQVSLSEKKSGKGGRIEIRYADLDDLDRLLERLLGR